MGKIEVLVATMNQADFDNVHRMNIQTDVLFADQGTKYEYLEKNFDHFRARMITTPDRGVGKNRNKALLYSEGDILLLSDEDMVYAKEYPSAVEKAYRELPDADMIIFGVDLTKDGKVYEKIKHKTGKLSWYNTMRYGAVNISIRRSSWLFANIYFSQLFGGGCKYGSGEDSLFIRDCFRRGLKIYSYDYQLGVCSSDQSTWFSGYTEKFFYDKGALLLQLFPYGTSLFYLYMALHIKSEKLHFFDRLKWMWRGKKGFRNLITYDDYCKIVKK